MAREDGLGLGVDMSTRRWFDSHMSNLISANAKAITITAATDFVAYRTSDFGQLAKGKVINVTDMAHLGMVLIAPMPVTAADIISNAGQAMTNKAVWVDRCLVHV